MILQDPLSSLNPVHTVGRQVGEAIRLDDKKQKTSTIRRKVLELLEKVKIPSAAKRMEQYPFQFSGGMRQRVLAAVSMARQPKLLIADEPTTALDVTIQDQFLRLLKQMQKEYGLALLLVTHDLGLVAETCDRVAVMYAGRIVETGSVERVFEDPAHPYTKALMMALPEIGAKKKRLFQITGEPPNLLNLPPGCSFSPRCSKTMDICKKEYPPFIPAGNRFHDRLLALGKRTGGMMETLLDIQGLTKHFPIPAGGLLRKKYNMLKAVDGVSFSVPKGTCFGIAGESGSGKTTISKLVLLEEKPTAGTILFDGKDITTFTRQEIMQYRRRVQPVFQDASSSLDPNMRIIDIVSEPMDIQQKTIPRKVIRSKVQELLRLVGIGPESLRKYPHELSGGQKQRVAIARALSLDPSLVILDEPVSALDVSIRAQILNLLADIQEERQLTYLVIAHDLAMLRQVTTQIAVMYLGKIMEVGETEAGLCQSLSSVYEGTSSGSAPSHTAQKQRAACPVWRNP